MTTILLLVLIAEILLLGTLVYNDRIGFALSSILITAVAYNLWFDKTAYLGWWAYTEANWLKIVIFFILYMTIGVLWSFFQYKRLVRQSVKNKIPRYRVAPGRVLDKISNWMIFWVLSVPIYFLTVPIQDLCKWIYRQFGGVYDRILLGLYGDPETHDDYGRRIPTIEELAQKFISDKATADKIPNSDFFKQFYKQFNSDTINATKWPDSSDAKRFLAIQAIVNPKSETK